MFLKNFKLCSLFDLQDFSYYTIQYSRFLFFKIMIIFWK